MCELYDPNELLAQAARAEEAGFDFVTISDHFHPWLHSHHHSPYAWTVLGALAAQTTRVSDDTCGAGLARHLPDDSLPPGDRGAEGGDGGRDERRALPARGR